MKRNARTVNCSNASELHYFARAFFTKADRLQNSKLENKSKEKLQICASILLCVVA